MGIKFHEKFKGGGGGGGGGGGATFSGCHRVIVTGLVAQERKFVANSRLKNAEKINFS